MQLTSAQGTRDQPSEIHICKLLSLSLGNAVRLSLSGHFRFGTTLFKTNGDAMKARFGTRKSPVCSGGGGGHAGGYVRCLAWQLVLWTVQGGQMSQSEWKSLSQEELRKRLYQTFKKKGVLDSLKTQLRNQLIQDLKLRAGSSESLPSPLVSGDSLLHRACNSLVADHLRRCGYEFSLSVFYPECGLEKEKDFTVHDLLQLMKINPQSTFYKSLMSTQQYSSTKGFLLQILTELIDYRHHEDGRDTYTQTTTTSPYKESIVEKMKFIDEQFEEMYPKRPKFESLEGKLSEYRREIEDQLQQKMSQEFQHFKDVELAKIKLEEREKSQKEITDLRRELERTYQLKYDGLVSREKNAVERLQRQQEVVAS
ncbi:hypothetical protein GDO78_000740 [Eleutherodactylus coqui]|uniref:LisH domain-containing protein n=1 Tax=Eleutherodactylus coqui TaxID=57060 RepID=A0A8J6FRK9_ELECQ|nr:hypothetical protein GDO78_000740 [Eleutherodactylus coqui]